MSRRKRGSRDADSGKLAWVSRGVFWISVCAFAIGLVAVSCEAIGQGLSGASAGGDGGAVTVAAARQTESELQAEIYAQALDAAGFEVERSYGHEGWHSMRDAFVSSGGAFVVPAQAEGDEPDPVELPGATMLLPTTGAAVRGARPTPVAGDDWARANPDAVAALEETTERLGSGEFTRMAEAVDSGESLVVAEVYEWRREHGLPAAPGVRPASADGEGEKA